MIEPDIILPAQFLPRIIATPEKRLLLAVLEEAVGTYQRYVMATDHRSRATFAEVEAWFASEDATRLFAFTDKGLVDFKGTYDEFAEKRTSSTGRRA